MKHLYNNILVPMLTISISMLGNGLFGTLIPIKLAQNNVEPFLVGLNSSAYYIGMVLGAFKMSTFISKVGHIRSYAALTSIVTICIIIHSFYYNQYGWVVLRLIIGYGIAGSYVVIESWMLNASNPETRGRYLSFYMVAVYVSHAFGQFFLNLGDVSGPLHFMIVAIFTIGSIIPLTMTSVMSPQLEEPSAFGFKQLYNISPSGVMGCLCAGLILGNVYGLLPLFASKIGCSVSDISIMMFCTVFGGTLLQYPVGWISDFTDRRKVLIGVCVVIIFASVIMIMMGSSYSKLLMFSILFLFGGGVFTLYPLSISHTCDLLQAKDFVAATQGLLLAYSIGAIIGPVTAPIFMEAIGPSGLFLYFIVINLFMSIFFLTRMIREKHYITDQQSFVAAPVTTPAAYELDPRSDELDAETYKTQEEARTLYFHEIDKLDKINVSNEENEPKKQ